MGDERMDHRLREYGARWREALPEPAEPAPAEGLSRRSGWLVAAAAVAVLVVVGGVLFAIRGGDDQPAPPAATSPTPPSAEPAVVVPWEPLPATHPDIPGIESPTADEVAAARACWITDLAVVGRSVEGAAGTTYLTVEVGLALERRGDEPCRLSGYPDVTLLDGEEAIDVQVREDESVGSEPVLVTEDHPALVTIGWSPGHFCPVVHNDVVHLRLGRIPQAAEPVPLAVAGFGRTTCNPGEEDNPPVVGVLPAEPSYYTGRARSPYEQVAVTGDVGDGQLTGDVTFTVTLTSAVDMLLEPCPDYAAFLGPRGFGGGLNCAAVPYRDDHDRPYLPADTPVAFEMRTHGYPGSPVAVELMWSLDVPGSPSFTADVTTGGGRSRNRN